MSSTGDVAVQSWARSRASFPPNFRPEPWEVEFVMLLGAVMSHLALSERYFRSSSVKYARDQAASLGSCKLPPLAKCLQCPKKRRYFHFPCASCIHYEVGSSVVFNVAPIELIMLPDNRNEIQTTVLCFLVVRVCLALTFVTASKGTLTLRDFTNFVEPQCS